MRKIYMDKGWHVEYPNPSVLQFEGDTIDIDIPDQAMLINGWQFRRRSPLTVSVYS